MKISALKNWQACLILFGPIILVYAGLHFGGKNELADNHGFLVLLLVIPIYIYHLGVGKELKLLLGNKTLLKYSGVIFCTAINFVAQLLAINWDILMIYFYPLILVNFGSYTYIILFTLKNTYLLETNRKPQVWSQLFLKDFIYLWTLPFGIWKFQPRLNKIAAAPFNQFK